MDIYINSYLTGNESFIRFSVYFNNSYVSLIIIHMIFSRNGFCLTKSGGGGRNARPFRPFSNNIYLLFSKNLRLLFFRSSNNLYIYHFKDSSLNVLSINHISLFQRIFVYRSFNNSYIYHFKDSTLNVLSINHISLFQRFINNRSSNNSYISISRILH
jgi:hypothetical protein